MFEEDMTMLVNVTDAIVITEQFSYIKKIPSKLNGNL